MKKRRNVNIVAKETKLLSMECGSMCKRILILLAMLVAVKNAYVRSVMSAVIRLAV